MAEHTPGLLKLELIEHESGRVEYWLTPQTDNSNEFGNYDGEIASLNTFYPTERDKANARRLAACWNALDGIPTDEIEAGLIEEMAAALRQVRARFAGRPVSLDEEMSLTRVNAVLARLGKG